MPTTKKLSKITIKNLLDNYLNFENKTLIFLDLETLGIDPTTNTGQITEMAAFVTEGPELKITKKLNYKIRLSESAKILLTDPLSIERSNWEYIQRRTGKNAINDPNDIIEMTRYRKITAESLDEKDALNKLIDLISSCKDQPILVAHNIGFDLKFLTKRSIRYQTTFPRTQVLDTLAICKYFFSPALLSVKNNSSCNLVKSLSRYKNKNFYISSRLGDLADSFGICSKNWHTAIADVEMMIAMIKEVINFLEKNKKIDIKLEQEKVIFRNKKS